MTKIGLDAHSFGVPSFDCEGGDVSGPMSAYAVPSVMGRKFVGETAGKVVRLSHIFRIQEARLGAAEDVYAGNCKILRPDWVQPKTV